MEAPQQLKILTLDPGKTTGIAIFDAKFPLVSSGPHKLSTKQLGPDVHYKELWDFLSEEMPDVIVCESFMFRQLDRINMQAPEYIGLTKTWCALALRPMYMQSPSQVKSFVPNRRLHDLNLYRTNMRHANDAIRHLVYFITVNMKDTWFLPVP